MPQAPISFEFFPPRDAEQRLILRSTWQKLARLEPRYLTVTFGAGGSTQEATQRTVEELLRQANVPVAPHISCMAPTRQVIDGLLDGYLAAGVHRADWHGRDQTGRAGGHAGPAPRAVPPVGRPRRRASRRRAAGLRKSRPSAARQTSSAWRRRSGRANNSAQSAACS